ncbi:MAG: Sortase family protein [Pelotomaculum sp. PtaB.Bin104]|nr:MAG: Sortase family protein [Pelotomaculum sp. PtaB.Bin104]
MKKLSLGLIILGVLLMFYPLCAEIYARSEQEKLSALFDSNVPAVSERFDEDTPVAVQPADVSSSNTEFSEAKIEIKAIGLSAVVVRGTTLLDLARGPGWYVESALPGRGNTAIAGHRTMYGAWFRKLDLLKENDLIKITFAGRVYSYQVEEVFVVAKDDWSVIDPCGYPALTLTTCHPVGRASQRLVVRAALVNNHV